MLAQPREGTDGEGNTGCLSVRRHCVLTQSVVETDSQSLGGKPEERTAWVGVPAEDAVHHDEEVVGRLGLDGVAPDVDAAGGGLLGAHGWVVLLREGAKRSLEKGELVSRVCAVLSGATPSRERAADSDDGPVEQLRVGEGDVLGHPRVGWPRVAYRRRATGRFLPWVPPRSWRRRRRGVATGRDAPHRE
jgi:hypothetical protein